MFQWMIEIILSEWVSKKISVYDTLGIIVCVKSCSIDSLFCLLVVYIHIISWVYFRGGFVVTMFIQ